MKKQLKPTATKERAAELERQQNASRANVALTRSFAHEQKANGGVTATGKISMRVAKRSKAAFAFMGSSSPAALMLAAASETFFNVARDLSSLIKNSFAASTAPAVAAHNLNEAPAISLSSEIAVTNEFHEALAAKAATIQQTAAFDADLVADPDFVGPHPVEQHSIVTAHRAGEITTAELIEGFARNAGVMSQNGQLLAVDATLYNTTRSAFERSGRVAEITSSNTPQSAFICTFHQTAHGPQSVAALKGSCDIEAPQSRAVIQYPTLQPAMAG